MSILACSLLTVFVAVVSRWSLTPNESPHCNLAARVASNSDWTYLRCSPACFPPPTSCEQTTVAMPAQPGDQHTYAYTYCHCPGEGENECCHITLWSVDGLPVASLARGACSDPCDSDASANCPEGSCEYTGGTGQPTGAKCIAG